MPIDPRIALGYQPIETPSPMNVMAQMQALQNARQENAMRQAQMANYESEVSRRNALLPAELARAASEQKTAELGRESAGAKLVGERLGLRRQLLETVATPEQYLAWHEGNHKDPVVAKYLDEIGVDPEKSRADIVANLQQPGGFQTLLRNSALGLEKAMESHFQAQDYGGGERVIRAPKYGTGDATVVPGSDIKKTQSPDAAARLAETRATEKAPTVTTVTDPNDPTRTLRVDARTYQGGSAGSPGVIGEAESTTQKLDTREKAKRDAAFPQATTAVKSVEADTDRLISQLQQLKAHPGLPNITGSIAGRTPSMTPAATGAQALYDTVVSKGQFAMLQNMRNMSKTGGALGAVSDAEGKALRDSFGSLSRVQSTEEFRKRVDEVVADLERTKRTSREAYDSTYAYKQGGVAETAPAASGGWGKAVVK